MNTFSGSECIRFGWETFKKRPWFFAGVALLVGILSGVVAGIGATFGNEGIGQGIGTLVNFVLGTFIGMGVTAFFLKAHDSVETVESKELWHPRPFWYFLGVKLFTSAVVVLGLILFIVPGIVFGLMFTFASYVVIDRNLGPIEAMKESKRVTNGHKWRLLGFMFLLALINILGAVLLFVGLLVTIPVTSLAFAHAYRTLSRTA